MWFHCAVLLGEGHVCSCSSVSKSISVPCAMPRQGADAHIMNNHKTSLRMEKINSNIKVVLALTCLKNMTCWSDIKCDVGYHLYENFFLTFISEPLVNTLPNERGPPFYRTWEVNVSAAVHTGSTAYWQNLCLFMSPPLTNSVLTQSQEMINMAKRCGAGRGRVGCIALGQSLHHICHRKLHPSLKLITKMHLTGQWSDFLGEHRHAHRSWVV